MQSQQQSAEATELNISVCPLQENDLSVADQVMRLAFGTFLGLPEPIAFMGDAGYVKTRWRANPSAAFAAKLGTELVGSNFATNWGSFGFFGPLTVHPKLWNQGVGKRLIEPVLECFHQWEIRQAGLFTFAQSEKHIWFYQKFDFWPQFLIAIMSKPVRHIQCEVQWTKFSEVSAVEHEAMLHATCQVTDAIYEGLDVSTEVRAVAQQALGETVLLWGDGGLIGLAVCHYGSGTEAGSGVCYIKFGAVKPGPTAAQDFDHLLTACEAMAAARGLARLAAGVNTARHEAYRQMLEFGFRTDLQGVAMQRRNESGYNRPGVYLIDDWR
ncbi:MAG: GNAT family N-acetyltransferase [Cyanobacteria bacterium J06626_18]